MLRSIRGYMYAIGELYIFIEFYLLFFRRLQMELIIGFVIQLLQFFFFINKCYDVMTVYTIATLFIVIYNIICVFYI